MIEPNYTVEDVRALRDYYGCGFNDAKEHLKKQQLLLLLTIAKHEQDIDILFDIVKELVTKSYRSLD